MLINTPDEEQDESPRDDDHGDKVIDLAVVEVLDPRAQIIERRAASVAHASSRESRGEPQTSGCGLSNRKGGETDAHAPRPYTTVLDCTSTATIL